MSENTEEVEIAVFKALLQTGKTHADAVRMVVSLRPAHEQATVRGMLEALASGASAAGTATSSSSTAAPGINDCEVDEDGGNHEVDATASSMQDLDAICARLREVRVSSGARALDRQLLELLDRLIEQRQLHEPLLRRLAASDQDGEFGESLFGIWQELNDVDPAEDSEDEDGYPEVLDFSFNAECADQDRHPPSGAFL